MVRFRSVTRGAALPWGLGVAALAAGIWACGETPEEPATIAPPGTGGEETVVDGAHTYSFDDVNSLIFVKVFAEPGTSGHDHVIRAASYGGTIRYDSGDPTGCQVDITLSVNDFGADEDAMRTYLGWETIGNASKNSVRSNMLAADQLNAASYPSMTYSASACEVTAAGVRILGDLTIRGVTLTVPIEASLSTTTTGLSAQGTVHYRQTSFGYQPYKLFGYENADEVEMSLLVEATRDD